MTTPGGANGSARTAASMRPDFSAASRCLGEVFLEIERHLRRAGLQRGNEVGQEVRRHRIDDAEPERAGQLVAAGLRNLPDLRRLLEHLLRLLDDTLADRRDRYLALAPLEQPGAKLLLELLDRDGQRGLAHEAALRGATEISLAREGDEIAQLVQRHPPFRAARSRRNAAKSSANSGCFSP